MKNLVILALLFSTSLFAAYSLNGNRNLKLPSQYLLERTSITTPAAASTGYLYSQVSYAGNTSAAAVTLASSDSKFVQPDVRRTLTITPNGTTADVAACDIVVSGTNLRGETVTDTLTFTANASSATTGNVAFSTVASIAFPADCEDAPYGATWLIGISDELGIDKCLADAGDCAWASLDGAFETTEPTCVADVDEVEKNTVDINGTLDGAKDVKIYFIQNFRDLN